MESRNGEKTAGMNDIPLVVINKESKKDPLHDDDYDPHVFRHTTEGTTNFQTFVHLLKGSLGTGILAMPEAFSRVGIVTGVAVTLFVGYLCTYCLHVLIRSQYILCKRQKVPLLSYSESVKVAVRSGPDCLRKFADVLGHLVNGFLLAYQLGVCCVYIVFIAASFQQVLQTSVNFNGHIVFYMTIIVIILTPIMFIRNLKKLAPLSTAANAFLIVGFLITFYYVFRDSMPSIADRTNFGPVSMLPMFFGTTLFAIEAIGVFVSVESEMKNPKDFYKIIGTGLFIVTLLYAFVGVLGFWKYGNDIKSTITLNLPENEILGQCTKLVFALAILFSYPLQCYVSVDLIWETWVKQKFQSGVKTLLYENILRAVIVFITFILAVMVPMLGLIISLFGALCLSVLGIAFPALIEMCTLWPNNLGRFQWIMIKDMLLIVIGLFALVTGTSSAVGDIVKEWSKSSS